MNDPVGGASIAQGELRTIYYTEEIIGFSSFCFTTGYEFNIYAIYASWFRTLSLA